jgi:outer membrane cobalamin receptor
VTAWLLAGLAAAAPIAPAPPVETVVVRAERLPEPIVDSDELALLGADLQDIASGRLDEALRAVAGAGLFRRSGSGVANATIQGVSLRPIAPNGAGRALVLLDGVPQNDPFGGWVIWSRLPTVFVERVSVRRGGAGVGAGAGALTGVVDITEARGGPALWRAGGGDQGRADVAFRLGACDGAGRLTLMAAHDRADGRTPVAGAQAGPVDAPAGFEATVGAATLDIARPGGGFSFRLAGHAEAKGAGLDGAESRGVGADASAAWRFATGDRGAGRLLVWAQGRDFQNATVSVGAGRASATPAADQFATPASALGASFLFAPDMGAWSPTLGLEARRATGRARERFRNLGGGFTRERTAGGAQDVFGLSAALTRDAPLFGGFLIGGHARLDAWRNHDAVRLETDRTTGATTLQERPADADGADWQGAVRLRHGPSGFELAVTRAMRPPTLNELHRPFRVGNDVTEANAALAPERLTGVEGGWSGRGRAGGAAWSARATIWANRLADPVANVTEGQGPGVFPRVGFLPAGGAYRVRRNAGAIDATGVELDAVWTGADGGWRVRASVAGVRARVDGGAVLPRLTGLRPAQSPEWTAAIGLDAPLGADRAHLVSLDLRGEGARFEDDLNTRRLEAFATLGLRWAWTLSPRLRLEASGEDVFDARPQTAISGDGIVSLAPGRTWRLGFVFTPGA